MTRSAIQRLLGLALLGSMVPSATAISAEPVTDSRLVLWLDAQDLDGDGQVDRADETAPGRLMERWVDKSAYRNHAVQSAQAHRPVLSAAGTTGQMRALSFGAAHQQYLSAGRGESLQLRHFTAFVVAQATSDRSNMWLFGKNDWGPPWTGYGIAVSQDGLHPWPHLGLGRDGVAKGVQSRHSLGLGQGLAIVEVHFSGERFVQRLNGQEDRGLTVRADILANSHELLIGAGPQATPPCEYLQGEIAEILLYNQALDADECLRVRQYLSAKYELPLFDHQASVGTLSDDRLALTDEDATPETRTLPPAEAESLLQRDWLFQAAGHPLLERVQFDIDRTRQLARRVTDKGVSQDVASDLTQLATLEAAVRAASQSQIDEAKLRELYFAVRGIKRRIMFRDPALDFERLMLIDVPYPQGSEWPHEALHHLGKRAASGGRLLLINGLHPGGSVERLMADRTGAYLRPDLSFDAQRILVSFKPSADKTYHLYELNIDGSGLRQLTSGLYDDISPAYLPDGKILFCTTRANSYVRCGPYIESTVLARCDADGRNIYLLSAGNEPDYTPTLLADGRVLYTRWEYTDKEQIRVQSLWTVNPDGTSVNVYWGNQSYRPDVLFEARPIPGDHRVMFSGVGHHDVFNGSIGIIDRNRGLNHPDGITKVTPDVPWGEVGDGPIEPREDAAYDPAGHFAAYRCPYPLSDELFLVAARRAASPAASANHLDAQYFHLYLMDVQGNRELIYEGVYNTLYALPIRPRACPPSIPDRVVWPGREQDERPVPPGILLSGDVCAGLPAEVREKARFLRVIQQDSTTFTLGCKAQQPGDTQTLPNMLGGPPLSLTVVDGIKRILGSVPLESDGSVCLQVPPCRALHFQLLDEQQRALQTMRSFANVMPGERRGCVGCHEMHSVAPAPAAAIALRKPPQQLVPPPWGAGYTLAYERDIQPILDRYCGACHQGQGTGRDELDLTLRAGAGVFREPYVTLVLGKVDQLSTCVLSPVGAPGGLAGTLIPVAMPPETMLKTVPALTSLSYKSPLIELATSGKHYDVKLDEISLLKLMAWIDLLCPYRGEPEIRAMPDPDPAPFVAERWPIMPRMHSAPIVKREYVQDEFSSQEDREAKQ